MEAPPVSRGPYYGGLGPTIVGVCWAFFIVATILLILRIYTYYTIIKDRGALALLWAIVAWVCQL